jgi:hypothetical protein
MCKKISVYPTQESADSARVVVKPSGKLNTMCTYISTNHVHWCILLYIFFKYVPLYVLQFPFICSSNRFLDSGDAKTDMSTHFPILKKLDRIQYLLSFSLHSRYRLLILYHCNTIAVESKKKKSYLPSGSSALNILGLVRKDSEGAGSTESAKLPGDSPNEEEEAESLKLLVEEVEDLETLASVTEEDALKADDEGEGEIEKGM